MMRFLRFLWLLARGVLLTVGAFALVFAVVAGLIWLLGEWTPLVLASICALALLGGLAGWVHSCWTDSRTRP